MWKCKQCGKCCTHLSIPIRQVGDEGFLNAHGILIVNGRMVIPLRCKYLTEDNMCSVWDTDKQFLCCKQSGEEACLRSKKNYEEIK